jgi:hypothetical protein
MSRAAKPGYLDYLPASYQVLGPQQDSHLSQRLVTAPASATTNHPAVRFSVRTPNVRCRTRVSLILEPLSVTDTSQQIFNSNTIILAATQPAGAANLWVCEREYSGSGAQQASPVDNVVGTGNSPITIPTDVRLWGYSFEIETNGQELFGVFVPPDIGSAPTSASSWILSVRYESVNRLSDEEWNQFVGQQFSRVLPEGGVTLT